MSDTEAGRSTWKRRTLEDAEADIIAIREERDRLREALRGAAVSFHNCAIIENAEHPAVSFRRCPAATCRTARELLAAQPEPAAGEREP